MADIKKGTVVMGTTNHLSAKTIVGNTTACPPVVIESKKIILLAYGYDSLSLLFTVKISFFHYIVLLLRVFASRQATYLQLTMDIGTS